MARLTPLLPTLAAACLAATLCGCGGDAKKAAGGKAEGEVLPGSASDAMLPYDTVRSQAPLAPKADSSANKAKNAAANDDKAD
ncbi:hypothetical protein [Novosphingobium sp.]|uniref:hypothetical protein n=1 Tax=Novosphingobium sp. TaxID=1874826 RepID=UPI0025F11D65|nr:hypothetical protein [Novosphingobium sp.]